MGGVCFSPNIFFQKDCLGADDFAASVGTGDGCAGSRCAGAGVWASVRVVGIVRSPGGRMGVTRGAEEGGDATCRGEEIGVDSGASGLLGGRGVDETGGARGGAAACAAVGDGLGRVASPR